MWEAQYLVPYVEGRQTKKKVPTLPSQLSRHTQ